MRIGQMNQRVTIQRRSATKDAYGQEIDSWIEVAEVWAHIRPIGGREKLRAFAIGSDLSHTVSVRYSAALLPPKTVDAWRIVFGSRIFNITASINIEEGNKTITFDCVEGSADGQ